MLGGRDVTLRLARRLPRRHEDDPIQVELNQGLLSSDEVTEVDGVEGPTHDAESRLGPHSRI